MSDNESPFLPDPFEEMVDKQSRNPFQRTPETPTTSQIPQVTATSQTSTDSSSSVEEEHDIHDTFEGEEVLYSSRRHPKYLWKRSGVAFLSSLAAAGSLAIMFAIIKEKTILFSVVYGMSSLILLAPFMFIIRRAYIEWSEFVLEVTTSVIRQYRAVSRLYYLRGPALSEMSSLDKVSYLPHKPTIPELYFFRNSLTVTIGTKISNPDKAEEKKMTKKALRELKSEQEIASPFSNMVDIWHPDELAAALKVAQAGR